MNRSTAEQIRLWAEKIPQSDQRAFDNLFRFMYPRLVRFAIKYTQNKAVASDITQDAFVILWEKRHKMDPERSIKGYLYKIVRNRSLNYIRDHSDESIGLEYLDGSRLKVYNETDRQEESEKLIKMMKEWISELHERQREAFELSRFEGLNHEEIAGIMEVSSNTVNNHIVAALNYLRNCYETYQKEVKKE